MSITSNLIDQIVPFVGSWSRSTGVNSILALIQEGQDELFDCDASGLIWKGSDNKGFVPYLTTVSETYKYDIDAAALTSVSAIQKTINGTAYDVRPRMVRRVFVDATSNFDFQSRYLGEPELLTYNNPFRSTSERVVIQEVQVDKYPALENDDASINFLTNPGATTEIFFVEFFWEPMRLTSELIPLCVPPKFYPALKDFVIGKISEMDNGKQNDRLTRFYSGYDGGQGISWVPSWKDQFRAFYDSGAQEDSVQTVPLF